MSRGVANRRKTSTVKTATTVLALCLSTCSWSACATDSGVGFQELAEELGIKHDGEEFTSIAWVDYDADGLQDLWLGNHHADSRNPASRLYLNRANRVFEDVWADIQLSEFRTDAHGANWVDFDGDGDQDLMITAGGRQGRADEGDNNLLFIQQDGMLREMAEVNNIHREKARGRFSAWFDIDHDGRLDILQVNVPRGDNSGKNVAAKNYPDDYFIRFDREQVRWPALYGGSQILLAGMRGDAVPSMQQRQVTPLSSVERADTFDGALPEVFLSGRYLAATADFNGDLLTDFLLYEQPQTPPAACLVRSGRDNSAAIAVSAPAVRVRPVEIGLQFAGDARLAIRRKNVGLALFRGESADGEPLGSIELSPSDADYWGESPASGTGDGLSVSYRREENRWLLIAHGEWPKSFLLWVRPRDPESQITFSLPECGRTAEAPMRLLLQTASGFVERTARWRLPRYRSCSAALPGDFDNDGDIDVYLACASRVEDIPDMVLWNDANTRFRRSVVHQSVDRAHHGFFDFSLIPWRQAVAGDYDGDGFLDVAIAPGVLFDDRQRLTGSPLQLLRNRGNGNNWLQIELVGNLSNRDGIGSRIELTAGGATRLREVDGGFNSYSQNAKRIHFGLGDAESVDTIRIIWDSGQVQEMYDVTSNQVVTIFEF